MGVGGLGDSRKVGFSDQCYSLLSHRPAGGGGEWRFGTVWHMNI